MSTGYLLHLDGQNLLFSCLLKRMQNKRRSLLISMKFLSIALTVTQSELHHVDLQLTATFAVKLSSRK